MNLLVAGDLFISDNYKNQDLISDTIENLFNSIEYCIVNLEAPLTNDTPKNRILKTGPNLRSSAETIVPFLKKLNAGIVTLANNHILDYGQKGIIDTFNSLKNNTIQYVGAGINHKDAARPITIEAEGMKIAILNFAENEWSIARANKPGANPLDIIDNVNQIKSMKSTHDKVICIIHGGHEYFHFPSPRMVKQYRYFVESGADAIVGHHTHCIGGYEVYKNAPIFYSLGNFLFTIPSEYKEWYTGLLVLLKIDKSKSIVFNLFPIRQNKTSFRTTLLEDEKKSIILKKADSINAVITDTLSLSQKWNEYVEKKSINYLNRLSFINAIQNSYVNIFLNRLGLANLFLNKIYLKKILNLIRCESHADLIKAVITKHIERL